MKKNPFYAFIWAILRPLILWLFPVEIQGVGSGADRLRPA